MPAALTRQGGVLNQSAPDVCKTPTPAGPTPVPYPNIAQCNMVDANTACKNVFICGSPALNQKSKTKASNGDEAGNAGGGVVSAQFAKEAEFINGSLKVTFEGKPAVSQGALTKHNKGNTVGSASSSAQSKVMVV